MKEYEKLGLFYLGRRCDPATMARLPEPVLYDSRDLVTHAVCVGMTGSGKTGLGITMIEEAALDGVPVLAIDPKGDLSNLLLTFPSLSAADFAPWVDATEAQRRGQTAESFAADEAAAWRAGLAEWDQEPARIARLRAAANVRVYTPGSRIATPLSLLASLAPPQTGDEEDTAAHAASLASSLLTMTGVPEPAPHSREHVLLTTILNAATAHETPADLPWLVQQIQRPAFERVGVLDLETFFPARDRQELALRLNAVMASPGFSVWTEGEPLDVQRLLFTADGRSRTAIVSIAHLDDAQRMLVVSLLLEAVLDWTRRQTGTGSLRALIYMDEVFGYLPPVANPPSKRPLLTLFKQARAYGVGVMLATQNPVDLDYKALSNAGTWFLGKLQTERDKVRVLDGIEGIAGALDRQTLDRTLSALRGRVFLMHNVHDQEPTIFETRWAMSYLRGPLGRDELKRIARPADVDHPARPADTVPTARPVAADGPASGGRPVLPAAIREFFLPADAAASGPYEPVLFAAARIHYAERGGIDILRDLQVITRFADGAVTVDWEDAEPVRWRPDELVTDPPDAAAAFQQVPSTALDAKRYTTWSRDFSRWVTQTARLTLLTAPSVKLTSAPDEAESAFRIRVQQAAREARDASVQKLRTAYGPKLARVTERARKAQETLAREEQQSGQQKVQTAVSLGATVLGALMGRRSVSLSTLGRATTAARGVSRSLKESEDVTRAQERLEAARQEIQALEAQLAAEIGAIPTEPPAIQTIELKPKRGAVDVRLVTLAWTRSSITTS